jgi:hypothetical protein
MTIRSTRQACRHPGPPRRRSCRKSLRSVCRPNATSWRPTRYPRFNEVQHHVFAETHKAKQCHRPEEAITKVPQSSWRHSCRQDTVDRFPRVHRQGDMLRPFLLRRQGALACGVAGQPLSIARTPDLPRHWISILADRVCQRCTGVYLTGVRGEGASGSYCGPTGPWVRGAA